MEAKSIILSIVPSVTSDLPGEFSFYLAVQDWEGNKCVGHRTILQMNVNFPSAGNRDESDWAIEVCDYMYQELTAWNARLRRTRETETNARPGDSSVSS